MDLSKSFDFFNPDKVNGRVHIVGCGSVGSSVAVYLARNGVTKMTLWDFDIVEPHNMANQEYRACDVAKPKVEALRDILTEINPDITEDLKLKPKGWDGQLISGYIFLCVDSIDVRRKIVETHMPSTDVKAMFDFRTLLTGAQHYAADWSNEKMKADLLGTMQFSHDDAKAETPVSACGVTLGVCQTVRFIVALGVHNFVRFVNGNGLKKMVIADLDEMMLDAF